MMASFNKGKLPAQQTKVVNHGLGPLKAGPTCLCVPVCNHDAASSKPSSVGRDVVNIHQQTKCDCVVNVCASKVVRLVSMLMNVVLFVAMLLIRLIT